MSTSLARYELQSDQQLCSAIIRKHSKSFAFASALLPPSVRHDTRAVYAWCRRADDAVDECEPGQGGQALTRLFSELDQIYAGCVSSDPVLRSFQRVVHARQIPQYYPTELLLGMEMDVVGTHYKTDEELLRYCYRAAGTVGLMMCHVMGLKRQSAVHHAAHLGIGMQLTNICRDVAEDWQRGRVYLSCETLERAKLKITADQLTEVIPAEYEPALARAIQATLRRAEPYYLSADEGAKYLSTPCAIAVRAARHIYSRIGHEIAKQDYSVFAPRAHTSTLSKVGMLGRAVFEVARSPRVSGYESNLPLLEFSRVGLL